MSWEFLSILGGLLELFQLFLLGKKKKAGFIFGCCAGICWISYTFLSNSAFGIYIISPIALILNIRGFFLWKN